MALTLAGALGKLLALAQRVQPPAGPASPAPTNSPAQPSSEVEQTLALFLPLCKEAESLKLKRYLCPAGVPTIGYGHTGPGARLAVITPEKAEELLRQDGEVARLGVIRQIAIPLAPREQAVLMDFTFNLGEGALKGSTLRRLLNSGEPVAPVEMAKQLMRWTKSRVKGQLTELDGLVIRRAREAFMWTHGVYERDLSVIAEAGEAESWLSTEHQSILLKHAKR